MGREDETDEEVYLRCLRVRKQFVAEQPARSLSVLARSFSAPNVISFEQWRDQLMRQRRKRELDTLLGCGDD